MKCVATIKNGEIDTIDRVGNNYTKNGSCMTLEIEDKKRTFKLIENLKDGIYYCPKEVWKQKVRDVK